jgi:hypothetical protein
MKKQFYLLGLLLFPFFIHAQNVGIGTNAPAARLQINHRSSTTVGLQLLDSFASRAGSIRFSTINNPVGMNISSFYESPFNRGHYLDINSDTAFIATFRGNGNVGLGVESPLYRLDINGDINTNGLLRINGNAGTAGQVLTSNGGVDPTWQNSSFTNSVRFAAIYIDDLTLSPSSNNVFTSIYNYSPADIAITTGNITINKSGLYHIEGYMTAAANFSSTASTVYTNCYLDLDGMQFQFATAEPLNPHFQYTKTTHFSQDIYLTAPAIILPRGSIGNSPAALSKSVSGKITGYLISE